MNIETVIQEKVHALPPVKQAKVLAYVEDLSIEEQNGREATNQENGESPKQSSRYSFVGIGQSETGDVSQRAEEILEQEIKRRSGWSMKDDIVD